MAEEIQENFGAKIAALCHDFFNEKLGNKGKPQKDKNEWTVLSAFIKEINENFEIVLTTTTSTGYRVARKTVEAPTVSDANGHTVGLRKNCSKSRYD